MKANPLTSSIRIRREPAVRHRISETPAAVKTARTLSFRNRVISGDVNHLIRQMSTLLSMHFTLENTLRLLAEQAGNQKIKNVLQHCLRQIQHGASLSDSLAGHADIFPATVIHFAAVGELTGKLGEALNQAAGQLEKVARIKRKILAAMAYPAVILIVACGAVLFLLLAVVPTFTEVFREFGSELPSATRTLIAVSALLAHRWYLAVCLLIAIPLMLRWTWQKSTGRLILERWLYRLPIFGKFIFKAQFSRFLRTLAAMLQSSIHLTTALPASANACGSLLIARSVQQVNQQIETGATLFAAMRNHALFPQLVWQIIRVGEEAGALPHMLTVAAEYYEDEVDGAVETLNAVLEPVLIVGLGLVLGAILIAMYMQIFSIVDVVR